MPLRNPPHLRMLRATRRNFQTTPIFSAATQPIKIGTRQIEKNCLAQLTTGN
jgi:hypothetical protein